MILEKDALKGLMKVAWFFTIWLDHYILIQFWLFGS